ALLAANGQQLAFEPMDYAGILGGVAGRGTIGGALAANVSGPRRIKAGAARDHFLGFSAVSGRGETFKSGGRGGKNVTGHDLCNLIAGSWGTRAAMTEVTIKVLPRPETEHTLLILGLDPARAVEAMTRAMGSSCDVSGAAHLPAEVAGHIAADETAGGAVTALRLEGVSPSVAERTRTLGALVKPLRELTAGEGPRPRALSAEVGGRAPLGGRPLESFAPARRAAALAHLDRAKPRRRACRNDRKGGAGADADVLRLGGRPDLGRARRVRQCRGGARAPRGGRDRGARDADPRAGRGARGDRRVRAAGWRCCRIDQAGEGELRSQGRAQSGADVGRGMTQCKRALPSRNSPTRISRKRTASCAPACIAASAPRPARPTCCSGTSSIRRAGAST